jgi:GDP-fucose transporter C1
MSGVFGVVASYWVVSIAMVYLNKVILSGEGSGMIQAPFLVTWFQCVVTCIVCIALGLMAKNWNIREKDLSTKVGDLQTVLSCKQFPSIVENFDTATCLRVMPLSAIFVLMIAFNNLCLQYVEVSFCKIYLE